MLTAITQFVKLRTKLGANPICSSPAMTASLTTARHLGKGPYSACQLWEYKAHVLKHHALPHSKSHSKNEHLTMLDNETLLQGIREYLADTRLGEVTPSLFQHHLTHIIFPSLGMSDAASSISESICRRWLHELGYRSLKVRKGLYVDGHERPDVIKARGTFLARMRGYHRYVGFHCMHVHRMNELQVHAYS